MSAAIEVVRRASLRTTRLSVDPLTGRVRLALPARASLKRALAWAEGKRDWIDAQRARLPQPRPFVPGARLPVAGEEVAIVWDAGLPRTPVRDGARLLVGGPAEAVSERVRRWLVREALRLLSAETAEYAARAGVTVAKVGVGDPRSRWGSCAATGAIRYSWRLLLAPPEVRRATVAHEVAHRVHMHHGPAFHALVAELYEGDVTATRDWLRRHGAGLHWFGREG